MQEDDAEENTNKKAQLNDLGAKINACFWDSYRHL